MSRVRRASRPHRSAHHRRHATLGGRRATRPRGLPPAEAAEGRRRHGEALQLTRADQLPYVDLVAPTRFVCDQVRDHADDWVEIRLAGTGALAWRQLAFWEGWEAFDVARSALRERYGGTFESLVVTRRSRLYLYGDRMSVPLSHEPAVASAEDAPWQA